MEQARAATPTILVVDDEQDIRRMVRLVLEREGYRVLAALDGEEGLRVAKVSRPDVILLDVMMPKMSGPETLRQLKAEPLTKDIPVIMLTSLVGERHIAASLQLGAACHLEKPCRADELLEEVKVAVWKRRRAA